MAAIPFEQRFACSIPDACEAIGVKRTTLYRLLDEGRVESVRLDGRRLIVVRSLRGLVSPPQAEAAKRDAERAA